jgi:23S rRNA (cytidine1920-2'-O)/16S rRNA (cytidine1409-2'-O)-methyltransferase
MMVAQRRRLDQALVERGLVASRERAQAMVRAGLVRVAGVTMGEPDQMVTAEQAIEVDGTTTYVSRGGEKLAAALNDFAIDPSGRTALDVGASTGGFTDALLQRGAARVIAVDVGYGQLAWSVRQDPRVTVMERVNIRYLEQLPLPADLGVIDVSFISLRLVLPRVRELLSLPGEVVALVKPQFEVGKGATDHGVVRDPAAHRAVLESVTALAADRGLGTRDLIASPILGPEGNREFLADLAPGPGCADLAAKIATVTGG